MKMLLENVRLFNQKRALNNCKIEKNDSITLSILTSSIRFIFVKII